MEPSVKRPALIHRTTLLDGFRALYLTHLRFDPLLKEDSYSCGYRDGFEASLRALAELMGISTELEEVKKQNQTNSITILRE